eukprot:Em0013g1023a
MSRGSLDRPGTTSIWEQESEGSFQNVSFLKKSSLQSPDYCEERRARRTNRAALSVCRNVNFGASGTTLVLNEVSATLVECPQ